MISLIVCSKEGGISSELKENIEKTIGVPYEIIVIDNSKNEYSIFSAYNEGVKKSRFNILCFMHEDILYHSQNWGENVINHLSDPKVGLIGLAGSYYLLNIPSPWYKAKPFVKNLIQSYPTSSQPPKRYSITEDKEVICLDGFWFCSRKDIFDKVSFDEHSFNNFHFYDLDISLQIHQKGYTLKAITNILVEHFSGGTLNQKWLESAYIFYSKWHINQPVSLKNTPRRKLFAEIKAYRDLLYLHKKNNFPVSKKMKQMGIKELKFTIYLAYILFYIKLNLFK